MKKLFLTIVFTMMMCMFGITAYAAEEPLTLDIEDGEITITATGYKQDGATEIPYTGSYIITGTTAEGQDYNSITINGVADSQTITLKDLNVVTHGPNPLTVNGDITLIATGSVSFEGNYPAIYASGTLTITGDADIVCKGNNAYGIQGNADITCNNLTVLNASMSTPAVLGNLVVDASNDVDISGMMIGTGDMDITSGGDATIIAGNSAGLSGHFTANVEGDLTITNNNGNPTIGRGAEITVGGDVLIKNESGKTIYGGLEANVGGNITIIGAGYYPTIELNSEDLIITAGSVDIENVGTMQAVTSGGELNITATDGDVNIKANTTAGGALTVKSTITALNGDITVVNTGDTFVVSNNLTATAKNIYVRGAGTSNPPASGKMILVAEEDVEIVTNSGKLSYPGSEPDLKYGGSVFVNDGTYTLEIEIAESKIEYNGES